MLARVICGREAEPYGGSIPYSQLKVSGVDVFSAGVISGKVLKRPFSITMPYAAHTKVTMRKGRVTGAVLFGNTNEGSSLLALVRRVRLCQSLYLLARPQRAESAAEALPEHETVCACNGVSKAAIMAAITEHHLESSDEVKEHTRASGSCGGAGLWWTLLSNICEAARGKRVCLRKPERQSRFLYVNARCLVHLH